MSKASATREDHPSVPDGWDRCHFYNPKKRRFCRQHILTQDDGEDNSPLYCGNHQHLSVKPGKRKRIPCPLDPSHTIFEDMVNKHRKHCPSLVRKRQQESQPYFRRDINCGGCGALALQKKEGAEKITEWAERVARRVLEVHQAIFTASQKLPQKLTLADIQSAIQTQDLGNDVLTRGLKEDIDMYRVKSGGERHLAQLASLVGHLEEATPSIRNDKQRKVLILEMGAGRGMFGLVVAGRLKLCNSHVHLTMVERAGGTKSKAETVLRNISLEKNQSPHFMRLDNVDWSRISCDLSHVDIKKVVEGHSGKDIIVIAKHLCGVGTDLALKSLEPIRDRIVACALAPCCHGVCNWKDYVGRDYLKDVMEQGSVFTFGAEEFDLLRSWSAGTVSHGVQTVGESLTDEGDDDKNPEHTVHVANGNMEGLGVSRIVKSLQLQCGIQGLGRACQRLIDYGRQQYLGSLVDNPDSRVQLQTTLSCYVSPLVTPQNALILAAPNASRQTENDNVQKE